MAELIWHEHADDAPIRELLLAAREVDGRPDVTADTALPREFRGGAHLFAYPDTGGARESLAGYAHLDTAGDAFGRPVAELVVHPRWRRLGIGTSLAGAVLDRADDSRVRFWAHGDHPGAARIAATLGLHPVRELLKMRLDFTGSHPPTLPVAVWPAGVRVRTFVPGQDEDDLIAVNAAAFSWHPEQGQLTADELRATELEDWFDPDGLFLATDTEDRPLGFHWTKTHQDGTGEVYVVGVDPAAQGGGLGRALTLAGLHHLHRTGRDTVILYVEADNAPAVAVYTKLGFTRESADIQYSPAPQMNKG